MKTSRSRTRILSRTNVMPVAAGAAGVVLLLLAYHARSWRSFAAVVDICPGPFCDFTDYYYPMGQAILRTGLPVQGFLYSPFIAILLALFPPLGLDVSLVLWGILQILSVSLYVVLFRRLVPSGLSIPLLFVVLTLSSYPLVLNTIGGQVSVFMVVALLGVLALNKRGRFAVAAGLFPFAVGFKFYPIIFLAPFAARRDARFLLFAVAACGVAFVAIPGLLLGGGDMLRFYGALFESFRESDWVVRNPHSQYFPHVALHLAEMSGQDARSHLRLLQWIAYGVAVANMGLVFLVQRARLRHADLWSFHLLFLTIPFVLKTSWPHDFVFLPFTQSLLAWRLLEGEQVALGTDAAEGRSNAGARQEWSRRARVVVTSLFVIVSIALSNIVFFNLVGSFSRYGFLSFLFWASLLLLIASYLVLLPPALRVRYSRR